MPKRTALLLAVALLSLGGGCGDRSTDPRLLRIGHFANVTHAHAVVAHARTRAGNGWFEERVGEGTRVEWSVYPAGPEAMLALLAGAVDLLYVGPSPVLNAYFQSKGREIRVLAGATRGGSALVVQGDGRIKEPKDFKGKRVATPQLGNTQDVACRAWLLKQGFHVALQGGDVTLLQTANSDQLGGFLRGELDAAWTVEPWVTRLEQEAGGKVFLEEEGTLTAVLVASARFASERKETAAKVVEAHRGLTAWLTSHEQEALETVRAELKAEVKADLSAAVLSRAWKRLRFDDAVARSDFEAFVAAAKSVGFLDEAVPLDRLVEAK